MNKNASYPDLEKLLIQSIQEYQEGKKSTEQIIALGQIMYEMQKDIHPFNKNTAEVIKELNNMAVQLTKRNEEIFKDKSGKDIFASLLEKLKNSSIQ